MKNWAILCVFCSLAWFSCTTNREDPRAVATDFLEALQAGKYEDAAALGTPATGKLLRQYTRIRELSGNNEERITGPVHIVSIDLKGNTATVYFHEGDDPLEQHLTLRRIEEDGRRVWRADLQKDELRWEQPFQSRESV
ncbi:MAG: hypothetical protein ACK5CT_07895 [Bacteroidota bacterium]|jgi:hypothetical protein